MCETTSLNHSSPESIPINLKPLVRSLVWRMDKPLLEECTSYNLPSYDGHGVEGVTFVCPTPGWVLNPRSYILLPLPVNRGSRTGQELEPEVRGRLRHPWENRKVVQGKGAPC